MPKSAGKKYTSGGIVLQNAAAEIVLQPKAQKKTQKNAKFASTKNKQTFFLPSCMKQPQPTWAEAIISSVFLMFVILQGAITSLAPDFCGRERRDINQTVKSKRVAFLVIAVPSAMPFQEEQAWFSPTTHSPHHQRCQASAIVKWNRPLSKFVRDNTETNIGLGMPHRQRIPKQYTTHALTKSIGAEYSPTAESFWLQSQSWP